MKYPLTPVPSKWQVLQERFLFATLLLISLCPIADSFYVQGQMVGRRARATTEAVTQNTPVSAHDPLSTVTPVESKNRNFIKEGFWDLDHAPIQSRIDVLPRR